VTDFGLSRCFAADAPLNLTQSGVTMGTPLYMSPEQVRGQLVDPRSDIYSFGVTCYHMLGGEPPFRAAAAFDIALLHVQGTPRPLGDLRPDLPRELCAIVHKMMAKRPDDRYQSAREILNDLARFRDGLGPAAAVPPSTTAFAPAFGGSSTNVPTLSPTQVLTQPVPARGGAWRYAAVAGLALAAAGGGAAVYWARNPSATAINPDDALADIDPAPSLLREKELKRHVADEGRQPDRVLNDLLDLTELYIEERRLDEALKLFDLAALQKLGALKTGKEGPQLAILSGLGRGVVLAHQDKSDESIAEFQRVVGKFQPKADSPAPKAKAPNPGRLEGFFNRPVAGLHWRRAVGEALDRDERNLGGKIPDDLRRLRLLPAKGTPAGRKGE
jgi:serine/threonine-protein kinase